MSTCIGKRRVFEKGPEDILRRLVCHNLAGEKCNHFRHQARGSVRRAGGFVVTGNPLAIPNSQSSPLRAVRADLTRIGQYDEEGPGSADPSGEDRSLAATGRRD